MKKLLYLILGIVAIVLVAAVAFVLLVDPNDYRDEIADVIVHDTGRELTIEGDLELSLFPWFAIDIGRTRVSNAPGFGDEPFASFEQASLSIRLLPMLFGGELNVGAATLDGLHLNLAVDANGRSNWQDLIEASDAAPESTAGDETPGGKLDIAGVRVSNASIRYEDAQAGETYRLTNLNVALGRVARGEPIDLEADFDFELQPADLAGDFSIDTAITLGSDGSLTLSDAEVSVVGIDMSVAFESGAALVETEPFSLNEVMRRLDMEVIETADATALENVLLTTTVRLTPEATRLDELSLILDDTTFKGSVALLNDAAGTISIDLDGDSIDLGRYMAPADEVPAEGQDTAPVEIPADLIRAFNVRGDLNLDEAVLAGMAFENVDLGINVRNGRLRLKPITAEFFDGTYSGDVSIDASGATPVLALNEIIGDVNVGALAKAMFEKDNITGTINGSFQLTGRGADLAQVQQTLAGSLSFELQDGAWEGTDVWYELRKARALLKKEEAPEPQLPPRTQFSTVQLKGPVADGVFRTDVLAAELPFMIISGKGSTDIAAGEVDYRLSARVLRKPEFIGDVSEEELDDFTKTVIPLRVTGPLAAPSIRPDVEGMLRKEAERKIKDALRDRLLGGDEDEGPAEGEEPVEGEEPKKKDDKDKLKDALKDLLGG